MKRLGTFSYLFVTGLLVTSGLASAATIAGTCTTLALTPTELNGTIQCSQFDNTLGTLTSIDLTIDGNIAGSISLTNNGATTQTGSGTTSSAFNLAAALAGFGFTTPMFTATYTTGPQTLTAGQTVNTTGLTGSGSESETNNTAGTFAAYEGLGNFGIGVSTLSALNISGGGGNFAGSQQTSAGATASVVYNYTAGVATTPEPSTMLFLGTGLLAMAVGLRRGRSA